MSELKFIYGSSVLIVFIFVRILTSNPFVIIPILVVLALGFLKLDEIYLKHDLVLPEQFQKLQLELKKAEPLLEELQYSNAADKTCCIGNNLKDTCLPILSELKQHWFLGGTYYLLRIKGFDKVLCDFAATKGFDEMSEKKTEKLLEIIRLITEKEIPSDYDFRNDPDNRTKPFEMAIIACEEYNDMVTGKQ